MTERKKRPKTLYQTIGCKDGASVRTVKTALSKLILIAHPDKHPGVTDDATKQYINRCTTCVLEVKKILCHPVRRRVYNYLVKSKELPPRHGGIEADFGLINQRIDSLIDDCGDDD